MKQPIEIVDGVPLNAPLEITDLRGERADEARHRLYPFWFIHRTADLALRSDSPHYSVPCADETEMRVAEALQPPFVHAEIALRTS